MKRWLLAVGLGLAPAISAQVAGKIATVNMDSLSQRVTQRTGVFNTLENEFRGRASELQRVETDPQAKTKKLQSTKAGSNRIKLEKDVMVQRQTFARKAQAFEQDRARHSNEERDRPAAHTQTAVKPAADSQDTDLAVDVNAVVYNSSDVRDITADVLKQVK